MGAGDDLDDLDSTCVAKLSELIGAKKPKRVDSQRPWVVIVTGAANVGKMDGELVIGRSPEAGVQIQEDGVSQSGRNRVCGESPPGSPARATA
jgi:hypothetical protein